MTGLCNCGQPGAERELHYRGVLYDLIPVCDWCLDEWLEGLEVKRREFGALLDAGWSREDANAEMIRRIEAEGTPTGEHGGEETPACPKCGRRTGVLAATGEPFCLVCEPPANAD